MDTLGNWKRTDMCAELTAGQVGREVVIMGWAQRRRDLGSLIFVWLRDRTGIVQLVFDESKDAALFQKAGQIRSEYVLAARAEVVRRQDKDINTALKTGEIELDVKELRILNTSETPPFQVESETVSDAMRLQYRYIDLRREPMQRALMMKNKVTGITRRFFDARGFLDIETPMLTRSTPEGARDYLVPSRVHPGSFYALPQSPQLFKQLLMVSGFDRYYQIVKCFRDEDLRANRQPEFQQIDVEMSFVDQDDVMGVMEQFIQTLFREAIGYEIALPLKQLTYKQAMEQYGSDKPDLRFDMPILDLTQAAEGSDFPVFADAIKSGGRVCGIVAKGAAGRFTRKELDALVEVVRTYRARGMAWFMREEGGPRSSFNKFLNDALSEQLIAAGHMEVGDALFLVADSIDVVYTAMGALRLELGERLDLIDRDRHELLWVVDFPLVEYDEDQGRYVAQHHPFTAPLDADMALVDSDIAAVRTKAYDMVCDGYEIGGGSIRIHDQALQEKVFKALGFSHEEAYARFDFLLEALQYGTPPHGGIAFGLDRLVMVLAGFDNIRDVIAFPKVQSAADLLTHAPAPVDEAQLKELGIKVIEG